VTGIGVVVIMGIVTFKLVNWVVTGKERRMEKIREHMIQEVITLNQQAMLALVEDINSLSSRMEHLAGVSEKNRQMLTQLQALYQNALMVLRQRKERYGESEHEGDVAADGHTG
jgi:CII-binding regulator of phage lambda lysogenization HflD